MPDYSDFYLVDHAASGGNSSPLHVRAMRTNKKNPAARDEAKRRGRNREEANNYDDTSFRNDVHTCPAEI